MPRLYGVCKLPQLSLASLIYNGNCVHNLWRHIHSWQGRRDAHVCENVYMQHVEMQASLSRSSHELKLT
jgi:hypothetical protein